MRDYTANIDSIGDGWDNAQEAADRWNDFIAPILDAHTTDDMHVTDDEPTVSTYPGIAQNASEWAWNQFCGTGAGDSDELIEKLANELTKKLG